jgi:NADP-dependent 3-hydroxy acid dehydrogenase YdfG
MKYIVVTGASTGIGRATAEHFLKKGDFVFGSVRKEADARALKLALGNQFEPLVFDVRDGEAIKNAAEIVKKRVGTEGVALLVNNAGVAIFGPMQHLSIEEYQMQFDINVFGVQRVTQAFLPHFVGRHLAIFRGVLCLKSGDGTLVGCLAERINDLWHTCRECLARPRQNRNLEQSPRRR